MQPVASICCEDYSQVKAKLRQVLSHLGGLGKFVSPNDKVVLKPNLSFLPRAGEPSITNPLFMKAMIELVKEITPYVYVADLPAVDKQGITEEILQQTGMMDILIETKTPWINMENASFMIHYLPNSRITSEVRLGQIFDFADVIINLPKLKSHGITYLTGCVKNTFGFVKMDDRLSLHKNNNAIDFSEAIVDIYEYVNPKIKLHIMDAVVAMEGDEGPAYGNAVSVGYIFASTDGVAIDCLSAGVTGHDAVKIPTNKIALMRLRSEKNFDKMDLLGDVPDVVAFKKHSNYDSKSQFPFIESSCQKCGQCYSVCPQKAILKTETGFEIDTSKCIKCYCCIENCIYGTIRIKN